MVLLATWCKTAILALDSFINAILSVPLFVLNVFHVHSHVQTLSAKYLGGGRHFCPRLEE